MMAEFRVVVVSPARPLYEGSARFLAVEGSQGQLGVAPRHADLVALLGVGPLRIEREGGTDRFAVRGGFLKVGGGDVTILVDEAVRADEVDADAVKAELDGVLEALRHPASDEEFAALLERRAWCQARLNAVHFARV